VSCEISSRTIAESPPAAPWYERVDLSLCIEAVRRCPPRDPENRESRVPWPKKMGNTHPLRCCSPCRHEIGPDSEPVGGWIKALLAVNTAACVSVWPTITFPKFRVAGEMVNSGPLVEVPVPANGRFNAGPTQKHFLTQSHGRRSELDVQGDVSSPRPGLTETKVRSPKTHFPASVSRSESLHRGNVYVRTIGRVALVPMDFKAKRQSWPASAHLLLVTPDPRTTTVRSVRQPSR